MFYAYIKIVVARIVVKLIFLKILFCLFFGLLSSDLDETWPKWILAVPGNFFDRSLTSFGGRNVEKPKTQKYKSKKNIKRKKSNYYFTLSVVD